MTISIENPTGVDLYYRMGNQSWIKIEKGSKNFTANQRCEISTDAITALGVMLSRNEGRGGTWSKFADPIMPEERKQIAPNVYARGK